MENIGNLEELTRRAAVELISKDVVEISVDVKQKSIIGDNTIFDRVYSLGDLRCVENVSYPNDENPSNEAVLDAAFENIKTNMPGYELKRGGNTAAVYRTEGVSIADMAVPKTAGTLTRVANLYER